jgi:hypothetical protein
LGLLLPLLPLLRFLFSLLLLLLLLRRAGWCRHGRRKKVLPLKVCVTPSVALQWWVQVADAALLACTNGPVYNGIVRLIGIRDLNMHCFVCMCCGL